jgi:hypothetical protein
VALLLPNGIQYQATLPGVNLVGWVDDNAGDAVTYAMVEDTADDNRCARVQVYAHDVGYLADTTACGNGTWKEFTGVRYPRGLLLALYRMIPGTDDYDQSFTIFIPSSTTDPQLATEGTGTGWSYIHLAHRVPVHGGPPRGPAHWQRLAPGGRPALVGEHPGEDGRLARLRLGQRDRRHYQHQRLNLHNRRVGDVLPVRPAGQPAGFGVLPAAAGHPAVPTAQRNRALVRRRSPRPGLSRERHLSCQLVGSREVSNLLDWWRRSGSAAMIFEVVAGVARETPAAFGLALERPAPRLRPPARVARERSV